MIVLSPALAPRRLAGWAEAPSPRGSRGRVLVLDGLTGSGKSSLAAEVLRRAPGARLLAVEEHVPGWDGLAEGVRRCGDALAELNAGRPRCLVTWDWEAGAPGALRKVGPLAGGCLVLEGCGALAAAARPLPHLEVLRVLVTAPTALRLARIAARDDYDWDVEAWQAQERAASRAWRTAANGRRPGWAPDVVVREG